MKKFKSTDFIKHYDDMCLDEKIAKLTMVLDLRESIPTLTGVDSGFIQSLRGTLFDLLAERELMGKDTTD